MENELLVTAIGKSLLDLSTLKPGIPVCLSNVTWKDYRNFLEIIGNRHYRTNYADGEYEILSHTFIQAVWTALLGQIVQAATFELDLPIKSIGMTTLLRDDLEIGLEPNQSFYLENEPIVRCRLDLDFNVDPPPDLALEEEVMGSVGKRKRIYAALRVPEVWCYNDEELTVNRLADNGEYVVADRSRFFPRLPMNELVRRVLHRYDQMGELELMNSFREWLRHQIAAGWPQPAGRPQTL
jgi:Uma2 family endonuclease